jgi:hypothetical protein
MKDRHALVDIFCGREKELQNLKSGWKDLMDSKNICQCHVLLGEPGIGKTRIIQEFYKWLTTDPQSGVNGKYWPPLLGKNKNNLLLNPDPTGCRLEEDIPFIWWAIRSEDPGERNASVGGGLWDAIPYLKAHLQEVYDQLAQKKINKKKIGIGRDIILDIAVEFGNAFTFNLLGIGKSAIQHSINLYNVSKESKQQENLALANINPFTRENEVVVSMITDDLVSLDKLMKRLKRKVPQIIIIDDAHNVEHPDTICSMITAIAEKSKKQEIPIMLILTHWENEWYEKALSKTKLPGLLRVEFGSALRMEIVTKEDDLSGLVKANLGYLLPDQTDIIESKADGNPRLLEEIIKYLRLHPEFFRKKGQFTLLTKRAVVFLTKHRFQLHELISERFLELPEDMQKFLSLASLQGSAFIPEFALIPDGKKQIPDISKIGIDSKAQAFTSRIENGAFEFSQRVYWDVANERVKSIIKGRIVYANMRDVVRTIGGETAEFISLNAGIRPLAFAVSSKLMLLKYSSEQNREYGALCLARGSKWAWDNFEYINANYLAQEFAKNLINNNFTGKLVEPHLWSTLIEAIQAEFYPTELLETLASQLYNLTKGDIKGDSIKYYINALISLGDCASQKGNLENAESCYMEVKASLLALKDNELLNFKERESVIPILRMAGLHIKKSEISAAEVLYEEAITMAKRYHESGYVNGFDLGICHWLYAKFLENYKSWRTGHIHYMAAADLMEKNMSFCKSSVHEDYTREAILISQIGAAVYTKAKFVTDTARPLDILGYSGGTLNNFWGTKLSPEEKILFINDLPSWVTKKFNDNPGLTIYCWPLPFYSFFQLVRIEDDENKKFALALVGKGCFIILNGASSFFPILNRLLFADGSFVLNKQNVLDYFAFYTEVVMGEEGSFWLIEDAKAIPWSVNAASRWKSALLKPVDDETAKWESFEGLVEAFGRHVKPAVIQRQDKKNSFIIHSNMIYSNAMFRVSWRVYDWGEIAMEKDEPIAADLPIITDAKKSIKRTSFIDL